MSSKQQAALDELKKILPNSKNNITRLGNIFTSTNIPKIAVFGKYNHGKSTLLNALIGEEIFKAADKRETVTMKEYQHDGVAWIDTPGLDADVAGVDDHVASKAAVEIADILFLVHNVKAGELDKNELTVYKNLMRQDKNYREKMVLILTQIDQLETNDLERVEKEVRKQMPDLKIFSVSSNRYLKGINENKKAFIEKSGMNNLIDYLETLKVVVESLRKKEIKRLVSKTRVELFDQVKSETSEYNALVYEKESQLEEFEIKILQARADILHKQTEYLS